MLSGCSTGRYSIYDYRSTNIRANREKPKVHKTFSKMKMKNNIKNNNTYAK